MNRKLFASDVDNTVRCLSYDLPRQMRSRTFTRRRWLATAMTSSLAFVIPRRTASAQTPPVQPPPWQERYVLDSETIAWGAVGRRSIEGIVYHRLAAPLDGADTFLRTLPPGGPNFCDPTYGGCNALYDFGIDHDTGTIYVWNDPWGASHPGVSSDRSPWANGPVENPSTNGNAFIESRGGDAESVNRDKTSIAISGGFDDSISSDGMLAIAWLSAYLADAKFPDLAAYPIMPQGLSFVHLHSDFDSSTTCPGSVVTSGLNEVISQTQSVMEFYRSG